MPGEEGLLSTKWLTLAVKTQDFCTDGRPLSTEAVWNVIALKYQIRCFHTASTQSCP